jgi:hypothetical protein
MPVVNNKTMAGSELSAEQRRSAVAAILVHGVRRWVNAQRQKTVSGNSDDSLAQPLENGSAMRLSVVDAGSNVLNDASKLSIPTTGENHVR